MPISFVRALTENASTPAMPTAAMITASAPNDDTSAAFSRRGATLSSRICADRQHVLDRVLRHDARARCASRPARAPPDRARSGSRGRRRTSLPAASGWNITPRGSASSPPSFVSPTTPTTVRQSPLMPMNCSTSPVHADALPDRVAVREEPARERLVEDHHARRCLRSVSANSRPCDQRDAGGAEVLRARRAVTRRAEWPRRWRAPVLRLDVEQGLASRGAASSSRRRPRCTPGIAATSSCIRSNSAFASSSFRASKSNGTSIVRIRSVVEARVHLARAAASCASAGPRPSSRMTDTAICATTRPRCRRWPRRPPLMRFAPAATHAAERCLPWRASARTTAAPRRASDSSSVKPEHHAVQPNLVRARRVALGQRRRAAARRRPRSAGPTPRPRARARGSRPAAGGGAAPSRRRAPREPRARARGARARMSVRFATLAHEMIMTNAAAPMSSHEREPRLLAEDLLERKHGDLVLATPDRSPRDTPSRTRASIVATSISRLVHRRAGREPRDHLGHAMACGPAPSSRSCGARS